MQFQKSYYNHTDNIMFKEYKMSCYYVCDACEAVSYDWSPCRASGLY